MPRSKLMRIILIAASALIIIGVLLWGWMTATEEERNVIEIRLKDGKTHAVRFEDLDLLPGEQFEYTVRLEKAGVDRYELSLDFVELEEGTLKNFAYVKIITNDGAVVYDDLLANAFARERSIDLSVDFDDNKNTELKIVYYLPIDVGNEAKNAEAIFELQLTAGNE